MAKGRSSGYVYGIIDPETDKVLYIGNAHRPWDNIHRHIRGSAGCPELTEWLRGYVLADEYDSYEILEDVVIENYYNPSVSIPTRMPNVCRVEWRVLGVDEPTDDSTTTVKNFLILKYKRNGQAIFNRKRGRPEGYTQEYIQLLQQEREARKEERRVKLMEKHS